MSADRRRVPEWAKQPRNIHRNWRVLASRRPRRDQRERICPHRLVATQPLTPRGRLPCRPPRNSLSFGSSSTASSRSCRGSRTQRLDASLAAARRPDTGPSGEGTLFSLRPYARCFQGQGRSSGAVVNRTGRPLVLPRNIRTIDQLDDLNLVPPDTAERLATVPTDRWRHRQRACRHARSLRTGAWRSRLAVCLAPVAYDSGQAAR